MKKYYTSAFLCFIFIFLNLLASTPLSEREECDYDLFLLNEVLKEKKSQRIYKQIKPYLLPQDHPLKLALNIIFTEYPDALRDLNAFSEAGFITIYQQPCSFIVVAKHPLLSGYLVKAYLDSEKRKKDNLPGWKWLVKRCQGAKNIHHLIQKEKLSNFVVPDKWLYNIPKAFENEKQPIILLVTDMNLVSSAESEDAWKNKITYQHLDELYCILSHGYASCFLPANIPYTKSGKFACIDTEYPKRVLDYQKVKPFLSDEMKLYWDKLVRKGGRSY